MKVADFIFTICIGAITFFFLFGAIPTSTQENEAASHASRIKDLEDRIVALTATVNQNEQTAANASNTTNAKVTSNLNNINNLVQRLNASTKHEDSQWVHIGGGHEKVYECPDGYAITGIHVKYHGGAWKNWVERVRISKIVPAK